MIHGSLDGRLNVLLHHIHIMSIWENVNLFGRWKEKLFTVLSKRAVKNANCEHGLVSTAAEGIHISTKLNVLALCRICRTGLLAKLGMC